MNLPPGPYHYQTTALPSEPEGNGHVYLCDATDRKIASIWGPRESKIALVNFIIEAQQGNLKGKINTLIDAIFVVMDDLKHDPAHKDTIVMLAGLVKSVNNCRSLDSE